MGPAHAGWSFISQMPSLLSKDGFGYWWVNSSGFSFFHNDGGSLSLTQLPWVTSMTIAQQCKTSQAGMVRSSFCAESHIVVQPVYPALRSFLACSEHMLVSMV